MEKLVLIDGNSIMNRAFYGIMGSKMLTTKDGKYTNAVYGFLAILFKILEDIDPQYLVVAFDLKAPTERHKLFDGYKANRRGMPDELAQQMPMIKEILRAMNIDIVEMEGYEADDVLGALSCYGEKQGLNVTILSGDRDTFQLATNKVTIRIPRTKMGKTETEEYDKNKIIETYGIEPKQLIDVKGLQGDSSDNIPGVPGIGEKTALTLIKKFGSIEELYIKVDIGESELKGKQKENIENNKELAILSKTLGTINLEVPIADTLEDFKVEEWDKIKVLELFKELNFNRFIDRFSLRGEDLGTNSEVGDIKDLFEISEKSEKEVYEIIRKQGEMTFYIETKEDLNEEKIIKEKIKSIYIYDKDKKEVLVIDLKNEMINEEFLKLLEDENIKKIGINLTKTYILLNQIGVRFNGMYFDVSISSYILNPSNNKLNIENLMAYYLEMDVNEYVKEDVGKSKEVGNQLNLFDNMQINEEDNGEDESDKQEQKKYALYVYAVHKLQEKTLKELEEINAKDLFFNIDMPTVEVLSEMQLNGIYVDEEELNIFGKELTNRLEELTKAIYELAEEEFNINSTKQLGEILFDKLKLPVIKKNKSGYSTDVDVLEKLKSEHLIIEKILEYRQLMKLNSTYIEGLKQYINPKTKRIHSFFHQTITATGRISSTEPNLQNIPTRFELGKRVRKVFKAEKENIYIDADYSQIELRLLAHISKDAEMINAFKEGQDIHKQAASKVFKTPIEEVTKEQRSDAKAVNFGIVYGISDFGLGEQLGTSRKKAKEYIDEYLEQYSGISKFMEDIKEEAKEKGYVATLFNRRRYIPELKSSNYMVRQFGARVAMNTPIQGTAADIMKISMIKVHNEIKKRNLKSKIILQVHDEMMIEAVKSEVAELKDIIKESMETAIELNVPLIADLSEARTWYDCK